MLFCNFLVQLINLELVIYQFAWNHSVHIFQLETVYYTWIEKVQSNRQNHKPLFTRRKSIRIYCLLAIPYALLRCSSTYSSLYTIHLLLLSRNLLVHGTPSSTPQFISKVASFLLRQLHIAWHYLVCELLSMDLIKNRVQERNGVSHFLLFFTKKFRMSNGQGSYLQHQVAQNTEIKEKSSWSHAIGGAIAGCASSILTQPFDVVKTKMIGTTNTSSQISAVSIQSMQSLNMYKKVGLIDSLKTIYQVEGLKGLWRGTVPTFWRVLPVCFCFLLQFRNSKN